MKTIRVEVVHALPDRQRVVAVDLPEGASAREAVWASRLQARRDALGRFGRRIDPGTALRDGDRVELLRRLPNDPREARRARARRR
jgi:putative ubiquitin-RnfH superfamily antitoxin RatB of RatAB toxin-antitoxin module